MRNREYRAAINMAAALVRFLQSQYIARDGVEHRLINGVFGIFGHGNVTGFGQAIEEHGGRALPYFQPKTEQAMVHTAVDAAGKLAAEGVEAEILDLRSLAPLDREAVLTTVAKTSRALLLHEATLTGGIGGELAAIISEEAFEYLDAPVMRVASADSPVPYSPPLEAAFLPGVDKVVAAAKKLVEY